MAAETGFKIDGSLLEAPSIDTFTMDEAQVLYDYSGLTLEDFARPPDTSEEEFEELIRPKIKNPGFVRALMHIAYQRANPKQNPSRVKALIGQANMIGALEHLGATDDDQEGDDGHPPASTTELEPSSLRSSVVSNGTSGDDSQRSSDEQADRLENTGTPESDTSSTSDREISAT